MQLHRGWWVTAVAIVNFLVGSYIIVMTVELLTPYIWAPYAGRDAEWGIIVNSFGTVFELFVNLDTDGCNSNIRRSGMLQFACRLWPHQAARMGSYPKSGPGCPEWVYSVVYSSPRL